MSSFNSSSGGQPSKLRQMHLADNDNEDSDGITRPLGMASNTAPKLPMGKPITTANPTTSSTPSDEPMVKPRSPEARIARLEASKQKWKLMYRHKSKSHKILQHEANKMFQIRVAYNLRRVQNELLEKTLKEARERIEELEAQQAGGEQGDKEADGMQADVMLIELHAGIRATKLYMRNHGRCR